MSKSTGGNLPYLPIRNLFVLLLTAPATNAFQAPIHRRVNCQCLPSASSPTNHVYTKEYSNFPLYPAITTRKHSPSTLATTTTTLLKSSINGSDNANDMPQANDGNINSNDNSPNKSFELWSDSSSSNQGSKGGFVEIPHDFDDMVGIYDDEEDEVPDEELDVSDWDDRVARFNTVHLSGRVGNDPEPRYFDDGKVVVNLSLASRRKHVIQERLCMEITYGEEETDWYVLEIWGQTAEFVTKYVDKGMRISVSGTLQIDEWNDNESGEVNSKVKVIVREVDMLESRVETEQRRAKGGGGSYYNPENGGGSDDGYYVQRPAGSDSFF
jgi:single-strand DNA-binding protein